MDSLFEKEIIGNDFPLSFKYSADSETLYFETKSPPFPASHEIFLNQGDIFAIS